MWVCPCVCRGPWRPEVWDLSLWRSKSCQLPDVGPRNLTLVLYKSSMWSSLLSHLFGLRVSFWWIHSALSRVYDAENAWNKLDKWKRENDVSRVSHVPAQYLKPILGRNLLFPFDFSDWDIIQAQLSFKLYKQLPWPRFSTSSSSPTVFSQLH